MTKAERAKLLDEQIKMFSWADSSTGRVQQFVVTVTTPDESGDRATLPMSPDGWASGVERLKKGDIFTIIGRLPLGATSRDIK
jgi:hypothetical protein